MQEKSPRERYSRAFAIIIVRLLNIVHRHYDAVDTLLQGLEAKDAVLSTKL